MPIFVTGFVLFFFFGEHPSQSLAALETNVFSFDEYFPRANLRAIKERNQRFKVTTGLLCLR